MRKASVCKLERVSLIGEWERSALTQRTFCEQRNLNASSFKNWVYAHRKTLRERSIDIAENIPAFVALHPLPQPSAESHAAAMELHLSNGNRLVFHRQPDVDFLKKIIS